MTSPRYFRSPARPRYAASWASRARRRRRAVTRRGSHTEAKPRSSASVKQRFRPCAQDDDAQVVVLCDSKQAVTCLRHLPPRGIT